MAAQIQRTFLASWRQKHRFGGFGHLVLEKEAASQSQKKGSKVVFMGFPFTLTSVCWHMNYLLWRMLRWGFPLKKKKAVKDTCISVAKIEVSEYTHGWISKLIFEKIILHCCYTKVVHPWSMLKQKHIQFTMFFFLVEGKITYGEGRVRAFLITSHRLAALDFSRKIPRTRRTPAGWVFNNRLQRGGAHPGAGSTWRAVSRSKSGSGGTATARGASGLISTWLWLQTSWWQIQAIKALSALLNGTKRRRIND